MKRKPNALSALIPGVLTEAEGSYPDHAHRIWEVWALAVGPELARRTMPLEFKAGKLTIAVEGASWLQQVVFLAPKIIDAVNGLLPSPLVNTLKTRAAAVTPPTPPAPETPLLRTGPLSEEEEQLIAESTFGIADPELAKALRSAREMALRRIDRPEPPEE